MATRYIGITLNVKPRISGPEQNDVSMLVDIQVNNLQGRARVFEEDLLGIPEVSVRKFRGQARVRNHRPLILGGREAPTISDGVGFSALEDAAQFRLHSRELAGDEQFLVYRRAANA